MKRVAHVLWRSRGGIRRHVRTIASHPPAGWETAGVFGPADLAPYFEGVPFVPRSAGSLLTAGRDADVVHAHGITAAIGAVVPGGPPLVVSVHTVIGSTGRSSRSALFERAARIIASRANAVIAVSEMAARGFDGARVIPPAFDPLQRPTRSRPVMRSELGADDDDIVVLTVSRLEPEKRLDLFVRAVERAGCRGLIVGDGSERARLEHAAMGTLIELLGHRDDIADLLASADIFALPSISESYGIAVAEAVGAGLPVVATRTGAIEELVGGAGIIVAPGDDDAFVASVDALVGSRAERMRLAAIARNVVRPDASTLIERLGNVYDEVLERVNA